MSWAGRIVGRSAVGLAATAWGRAGRTLAMLRQTILGAGGGPWPVAGPPGRAGRDGRLVLALRLTLRAEGVRAARRESEPRRTPFAAGPSSRLVERVRLVEAGGTPGRAVPVTHRRPAVVLAAGGDGERVARPARTITAVLSPAAGGPAPASVPRVLAVARPPAAPPQPEVPATAPTPQTSAPFVPRSEWHREAPMPAAPAASWLAGPSLAAIPPAVVEQLTDRVVRAIDRRVIAARERFGLGPG